MKMNDNGPMMPALLHPARSTFSKFGRDVNLLLTATGILAISFFGIQMLLKILYVLRLGYGPAYLGMFNAAGALGYMAMSLPAGVLGTRLGLKRAMFIGVTVSMFGVAMLPFAEFVPLQAQPSWPILSQLILSGGYAMFSINLVPALMATTTDEEPQQCLCAEQHAAWARNFRGHDLRRSIARHLRSSDRTERRYARSLPAGALAGRGLWAGGAFSVGTDSIGGERRRRR